MLETTVWTFDVNVHYDRRVRKFDIDEATVRSFQGINLIFRDYSNDILEKAINVVQALQAGLGKHIQENIEIFKRNGAAMSTECRT